MEIVLSRFGVQLRYPITEQSEVAAVRRSACSLANLCSFNEVRTGELALVITEAATNILKFASSGEILIRSIERKDAVGIEVLAIDSGPGMADIPHHMRDGNSTAGTYGVGLGTIERLSDEFDIFSNVDDGLILYSLLWRDRTPANNMGWQVGAICLPIASEEVSGDAFEIRVTDNEFTLLMSDGLGHGYAAADASRAAQDVIINNSDTSPFTLLQKCHNQLKSTRGAAVAIACLDRAQAEVKFAGVGNIAMCVYDDHSRKHLVSHNGIVGANIIKIQEFKQPWVTGNLLIGHSDGINTRWDLHRYPALLNSHPALIAALLYRDFSRGRDDVSVVVLRDQGINSVY